MFTRRLGVLTALVQGLGLLQGSRISVRLFGDHYSTKVSRSFVSKEVSRETVVQRERESFLPKVYLYRPAVLFFKLRAFFVTGGLKRRFA